MKKLRKITLLVVLACSLVCAGVTEAASVKMLSVDVQKVFENYNAANVAQAALKEAFDAADRELKDMFDAAMKLQEEIGELNEKAENSALLDSVREKFKNEAAEKLETLRVKEKEFVQFRQDVSKRLSDRRNKELGEQLKAIEGVVAEIAKGKKVDVVLPKNATLFIDDTFDITQPVIDKLNAK
jgi:outer membrane protein